MSFSKDNPTVVNSRKERETMAVEYMEYLDMSGRRLISAFNDAKNHPFGLGYVDVGVYLTPDVPELKQVSQRLREMFPGGTIKLKGDSPREGWVRVWAKEPNALREFIADHLGPG